MRQLLLTITFIVSTAISQEYIDAFLKIGATPRTISLGQAVVALPQNPGGYLVNPAASGFSMGRSISGMYINQFGMADFYSVTTNYQWRSKWQVGLNVVNLSIDNIAEKPDLRQVIDLETRRDSIRTLVAQGFTMFRDTETGIFVNLARNFSVNLDLGWQITPFSVLIPVGINIKILHKELYNLIGNGIGFDLGSMLSFRLSEAIGYDWLGELTLGFAVTDVIGSMVYWNSGKYENISAGLVTGIAYRQQFRKMPLDLILLFQDHSIETEHQIGIEAVLKNMIVLRLGNKYGEYTGGLGLNLKIADIPLSVDYGFSDHDLGNAHRIGGSFTF